MMQEHPVIAVTAGVFVGAALGLALVWLGLDSLIEDTAPPW